MSFRSTAGVLGGVLLVGCGGSGGASSSEGDGGSGDAAHDDAPMLDGSMLDAVANDATTFPEASIDAMVGTDASIPFDAGTEAEPDSEAAEASLDAAGAVIDAPSESSTDAAGKSDGPATTPCPGGMETVPIEGGGNYCIDAAEVSNGDYEVFFEGNPPTSAQPSFCAWNLSWNPTSNWILAPHDDPIVGVNWCQAYAYCAYVGSHLCGSIQGASVALTSFNDPTKDAWFNACSAGGTKAYPYGNTYNASTCDGASSVDGGAANLAPPNAYPNCVGGEPNLFAMSGNAAEWEDSCSGATGATDPCAVRGGSFEDTSPGLLRCDSAQVASPLTQPRNSTSNAIGFRCCL